MYHKINIKLTRLPCGTQGWIQNVNKSFQDIFGQILEALSKYFDEIYKKVLFQFGVLWLYNKYQSK